MIYTVYINMDFLLLQRGIFTYIELLDTVLYWQKSINFSKVVEWIIIVIISIIISIDGIKNNFYYCWWESFEILSPKGFINTFAVTRVEMKK